MNDDIQRIIDAAKTDVAAAVDADALADVEVRFLGRKQGMLTALIRELGKLDATQRKARGQELNAARLAIEHALADAQVVIASSRMATLEDSEWIDVTEPGEAYARGAIHPISEAIADIAAIFERIGFLRARHPEVDSDYYAFESLNMPKDHPARDEWETFFVAGATKEMQNAKGTLQNGGERIVLTPHTSNGQVREMEKGKLPIRMVNIARCYRRQMDVTHTPMFHQFEGLLVDQRVSVTHLKGTLDYFVQSYFGPDRRTRLRPFHFRFTEPSFEIDITCAACGGTGVLGEGKCRTCKSGWLELGGAGMVHPNVLTAGGIDPKEYSGFAFGWGVERVLMMKRGMSDIRALYSNDLRFLAQF